jgi:hypothetical protein
MGLAHHAMCIFTHECTDALLYGILVRMHVLVHKHVIFVVFNLLIAWDFDRLILEFESENKSPKQQFE